MRYAATSTNSSISIQCPQVGATKKCSCRIDDTECASVSTGAIEGEMGVTWVAPRPGAVAPISTMRSA
jgi:hypothetical protein